MIAIGLRFPGGRYHATPWGRHVNEGEIAWPPSPWRLSRALIATWHRKLTPEERDPAVLERLLSDLATELPVYALPEASGAHARHFMPTRKGKGETKTLVFDAFARLEPDTRLVIAWPSVELEADEVRLLDRLLERLGYLGRAESWVEAGRLDRWDGTADCVPADGEPSARGSGENGSWEPVELLLPRPPGDYESFRAHLLDGLEARGASRRERRKIGQSLPESWLDALAIETGELERAGWSRPPAAVVARYLRPAACLQPRAPSPRRDTPQIFRPTTASLALFGRPLPRIEDAVKIGEALRAAVVYQAGRVGDDPVPPVLSGHFEDEDSDHRHAFYLPEDRDGDGFIDHLTIHAEAGFGTVERQALARLSKLWTADGRLEWKVIFERAGSAPEVGSVSRLMAREKAETWISETPYLHPWHVKKKLTIRDQIRKEWNLRDAAPELVEIEPLPEIEIAGRRRRPIHYHRFRSKRGLAQPDRHGSFWRLTFNAPLHGPVALGFGCHFGLGLFRPDTAPGSS